VGTLMRNADSQLGLIDYDFHLPRDQFDFRAAGQLSTPSIIGVYGPSGAGKTTMLRCIAGLEPRATARFAVDGDTWDDTDNGIRRPVQLRDVGYVFQEPRLFAHLDVRRNLDYGQRRSRGKSLCTEQRMVELLGLESVLTRKPERLSGGEAQRVAIGRAMLRAPKLLLMDEPVASLDVNRRQEILPFIDTLHREFGLPIVYVSHSLDELCHLCDWLLVIEGGKQVASGELQDVLARTDLELLGRDEAGAVVFADVLDYDSGDDLSRLQFSGGELFVPGRLAGRQKVRVRIRANDVSLSRERPQQTSILNHFEALVTGLKDEGTSSVLVHLTAGDDFLLARVTRRSAKALALEAGMKVFVSVKTIAVRNTLQWDR
jgi:molybdate transport system ATP-binding protein